MNNTYMGHISEMSVLSCEMRGSNINR